MTHGRTRLKRPLQGGTPLSNVTGRKEFSPSLQGVTRRACTAYLPLIWGWATLVWMRHREYI